MQPERQSICALVSGGLDSCVMLVELVKRHAKVYPVFIRHGLIWEEAERRHLRRFLRAITITPLTTHYAPLTILDLPVRDLYSGHWSTTGRRIPGRTSPDAAVYLPGRNLLLLSKAAIFCARHDISTIAIGSLRGNPFPDATPAFFRQFATAAGGALGCRLRVIAPLRCLTKAQVIRRGARLGLPLHLSFSCIAPRRGQHCGRCNKCAERQRAFVEAGVEDHTRYAATNPHE
jgi:7-cyano-7-deazaguanine synthase